MRRSFLSFLSLITCEVALPSLQDDTVFPGSPGAVMTAAAASRRTGAAAPGGTTSLFVVLALLTLLCPAASFIDEVQLEDIIENIRKLQKEAERRRDDSLLDNAFLSEVMGEVVNMMDPLLKVIEKAASDFPPLLDLMKALKVFLESSTDRIIKQHQDEDAKLIDNVEKLIELEEVVMNLAERTADL